MFKFQSKINFAGRDSTKLILSAFLELFAGLAPIVIVPILIFRVGINEYSSTLKPIVVTSFLLSVLDFGFNLVLPTLWIKEVSSENKVAYIFVQFSLKLIGIVTSIVILYVFFDLNMFNGLWFGAILHLLGQSMFPSWFFLATGNAIIGQALNNIFRVSSIALLLLVIDDREDVNLINYFLGFGSSFCALISYVLIFKNVNVRALKMYHVLITSRRLFIPLLFRCKQLWFTQIVQSGFRMAIPVLASHVLLSSAFVAFNLAEKILRSVQAVQSFYFQSRIFPILSSNFSENIKRVKSEIITNVIPVTLILSSILVLGVTFFIPLLFPNAKEASILINESKYLLALLVVVGGVNYWIGGLVLPFLKMSKELFKSSFISGFLAVSFVFLIPNYQGFLGVALSIFLGEFTFLVLNFLSLEKR